MGSGQSLDGRRKLAQHAPTLHLSSTLSGRIKYWRGCRPYLLPLPLWFGGLKGEHFPNEFLEERRIPSLEHVATEETEARQSKSERCCATFKACGLKSPLVTTVWPIILSMLQISHLVTVQAECQAKGRIDESRTG